MNDKEPAGTTPPQHIIALTARNVKRLKAVQITTDGRPVTVIGGRNAQGKSSVLDAIIYALAGKRSEPKNVIRNGESGASVTIDTEDFIIAKRWTASGGAVTITARDGRKYSRAQDVLDGIIGRVCLDPLEFARMKPDDQAETIRRLTGLDTSAIDAERARLYAERTDSNREADRLRVRADQAQRTRFADVPRDPIDTKPIMDRLASVNADNEAIRKVQDDVAARRRGIESAEMRIAAAKSEITRLERELARAKASVDMLSDSLDLDGQRKLLAQREAFAADMKPISSDSLLAELAKAQGINEKVAANKQALQLIAEASAASARAEEYTAKIKVCDDRKTRLIEAAHMPVQGLAIEDRSVTFNGIPIEQASTAEQIRISCAIGLALNPTLRTLIVREGSLLDDDALKMLADIATANNAQIIMERVGVDAHTSVIIEDGEIADAKPQGELPLA